MIRFPQVQRAMYEAAYDIIINSGRTPQIMVFSAHDGYIGPVEYEDQSGVTTFKMTAHSLGYYEVTDKGIAFDTKFSGIVTELFVPWGALVGLYALEDPQAMGLSFVLAPKKGVDNSAKASVVSPPVVEKPEIKLVRSNNNPKPSTGKQFRPTIIK